MDQKTRSRIAIGLSVVLVPTMVFLLYTNISKARERRRRPADKKDAEVTVAADPAVTAAAAAAMMKSAQQTDLSKKERAPIDPDVMRKQREIAALSPRCNPFGESLPLVKASRRKRGTATPRQASIKVNVIVPNNVPSKRMAMINGKMVRHGDQVDGWTIVTINNDNVVLDDGTKKVTIGLR